LPPVTFGQVFTLTLKQLAQFQRGILHEGPSDAFSRIEVDDQPIGMLDIVDRRIPGMQLDGADFHQADEACQIVDPQPNAFASFALLHLELMECWGIGGNGCACRKLHPAVLVMKSAKDGLCGELADLGSAGGPANPCPGTGEF
jgi:hypothetical protein